MNITKKFHKIALTQGYYAMVDCDDIDLALQYRWRLHPQRNGIKYAVAEVTNPKNKKRTIVFMHRLITGAPANKVVDHINGDGLDNRRSNLRLCTRTENIFNSGPSASKTTSRFKGVYFHVRDNVWATKIGSGKKSEWLGYFKTEREAAQRYNEAAKKRYGEFAWLNPV